MNDELANPMSANIQKVFDSYGGVTFEQIDEYTFKMIATDPASGAVGGDLRPAQRLAAVLYAAQA